MTNFQQVTFKYSLGAPGATFVPFATFCDWQCVASAKEGFVAGLLECSEADNKDWAKATVSIAAR
jgi:hypothetical protein